MAADPKYTRPTSRSLTENSVHGDDKYVLALPPWSQTVETLLRRLPHILLGVKIEDAIGQVALPRGIRRYSREKSRRALTRILPSRIRQVGRNPFHARNPTTEERSKMGKRS